MSAGSGAASGALSGASTGAMIGTAIPIPGGTLIGAGIGALAGGISGALSGRRSKARRLLDRQLQADIGLMNEGKLGLDPAERSQFQADASRAIGAQLGAAQSQVSRDSLGGGGQRDLGAYVRAQRAIGEGGAEASAQASRSISEYSQNLAQQQAQDIRTRLGESDTAAQQRKTETSEQMAQAGDSAAVISGLAPQWWSEYKKAIEKKQAETISLLPSTPETISPGAV